MPERVQSINEWDGVILYRGENGADLMNKESLLSIERIENRLKALTEWQQVCKANSTTDSSCSEEALVSPLSVLKDMGVDNLQTIENGQL